MAMLAVVKWAGVGPEVFSVRVDLVAPDHDSRWVSVAAEALVRQLPFDDSNGRALAAVDQGRGYEDQAVVGFTFLVRATGFAGAAQVAVDTAIAAGTDAGVGGHVYDVVLVPDDALTLPDNGWTIPLPD